MNDTILVLDAMGVIYTAADDVAELLVPFVVENGGVSDSAFITDRYTRASLGEIDAPSFWRSVGLSPTLEDDYLSQHRLTNGLAPFLDNLPPCVSSVWCLSNDVTQWSKKLRSIHDLEQRFAGFVISGDVGVRKPDPGIYHLLLDSVRCPAERVLFVDDRPKNLDAALSVGFRTILFSPTSDASSGRNHPCIRSFDELMDFLHKRL